MTHLLEWPKYETVKTPNAGKCIEPEELSFIVGRSAKGCIATQRQFVSFLQNYDPVIIAPGIYPKELKTCVHTKPVHKRL